MRELRQRFGVPVGYSGHERGVAISVAAAALGANVIEKHITLDRAMKGSDHSASLEPDGLKRVVHYVRISELALGDGKKRMLESEIPVRQKLAKSVAAARPIPAGTVISADMLIPKGPGTGLKPAYIPKLIGRVAACDVAEDTLLPLEAVSWREA